MWALLILSPFKGFSSRNRREVPRRAPHRRLSAHRRPPIAPTLPPPGRQVARGAGAAGSLQPFVEILPNDFAVPSSGIPQSITVTLSSSSYPGHLQFTASHSFRAKDRNTVCVTKLVPLRRAFGKPTSPNDRGVRRHSPRKYTLRHLPPFAICEDATVRDDWIVEPNSPYCFKESAQADERPAPDVNAP
jgi:hypothetical protein